MKKPWYVSEFKWCNYGEGHKTTKVLPFEGVYMCSDHWDDAYDFWHLFKMGEGYPFEYMREYHERQHKERAAGTLNPNICP